MGDAKDRAMDAAKAAIAREKEKVAQEVERHKDEDVDLEDLEDVSGGWRIYSTDPKEPEDPVS